jgi:hypothetical protein
MAIICVTMRRGARRECAVLDGKRKTEDLLCCCKLCIFLSLPMSVAWYQLLSAEKNWFELQLQKSNQGTSEGSTSIRFRIF